MSEKKVVGGVPVECLTGEPAAVWSGWRTLGDREVVREASAKGTHINLAHRCLAFRRNTTHEEARIYFNEEVDIWIKELLGKRQIYRASHILNNVGKDPKEYIFAICIKCKDPPLRDYLAEYLRNCSSFDNDYVESWHILKSLVKYEEIYNLQYKLTSHTCIEDVVKLSKDVKEALCTELYFHTTDKEIVNTLTSRTIWDYLLTNNKIDLLRFWIDCYYKKSIGENTVMDDNIKLLLSNLEITSEMIEFIESSNASTVVKDMTLNHLCRYGIFISKESKDKKLLLGRVFNCPFAVNDFQRILASETCNLNDKMGFSRMIDRDMCLERCFLEDKNAESSQTIAYLYDVLTNMCNNQDAYPGTMIDGIMEPIKYLSNDTDEFLKENYMLVFALLCLQHQKFRKHHLTEDLLNIKTLSKMLESNSSIKIGEYIISHELIKNMLENIPLLQQIVNGKAKEEDITMYDLLDGYENLNIRKVFKWRFKNHGMPHFSRESLIKKYGYKESLSYTYYLKEGRPNMAIRQLKQDQEKILSTLSFQAKSQAAHQAHVFALRHLNMREIVCSCISFIEMLGMDSGKLRLHITVADYIQKEIGVSIGQLLEPALYKNQKSCKQIMVHLKDSFMKTMESKKIIEETTDLMSTLQTWDILVKFARVHSIELPDCLLKFLACHNNWLEFMLVGQIFSHPIHQMLETAKQFQHSNVREHMLSCLNNPHLAELYEHDQKITPRDTRQSLYYKIGLRESPCFTSSSQSTSSGSSSYDSHSNSLDESVASDVGLSVDDDVWMTILKCHHSQDPPRALISAARLTLEPIYAVLATCYEPSSITSYCYSWMVISTARENFLYDYADCLDQQIWSAKNVMKLMKNLVSCGYITVLNRAFKIFMPESLFNPFFEYLLQCMEFAEFKKCQEHLLNFKSQCLMLKCNKSLDWDSADTSYNENSYWVATVALHCIMMTLAHCLDSALLQIKFLETLVNSALQENFPVCTPDFKCLLNVTNILLETDTKLNFVVQSLHEIEYNYTSEFERCINHLVLAGNYEKALCLSEVVGINPAEVIVAQYKNEVIHRMSTSHSLESEFWKKCALDFKKYNVDAEKAAAFFIGHAENVRSHKERYEILRLALETLENSDIQRDAINAMEMAMWKSCILAGPTQENIELGDENLNFNKLKTVLLSDLHRLQGSCTLTNPGELHAADELINRLLDIGRMDKALRISAIFNCKHKDLQILLLCLSLAEGETLPNDLTAQQQLLVPESGKAKQQKYSTLRNRGLRRLSSSSSLNVSSSSTSSPKESDKKTSETKNITDCQIECMSLLEKLMTSLQHGISICTKVVLCYKLSVHLGKSYQALLMLNNPIEFLQDTIEKEYQHKLEIANDIIAAYKIKSEKVAAFLAYNISVNVTRAIEGGYDDVISMWGYPLDAKFHLIMELCNDPSLLGMQLFKTVCNQLGRSHGEKRSVPTLKIAIELLIRSHDCFTASCNMEGIALVLRKSQQVANVLQIMKLWALLVRLVTGIGRFTEMNYIFQILKENDQFEFLLGKGLDKIPGLKTALLEFLKRDCPENRELFTLVALHFRLYREMALAWENEAKELINELVSEAKKECAKTPNVNQEIRLMRNESVQKRLHSVVTSFTHATQYYLQDDALNFANRCSGQAQLANLQIALLNTVPRNQQVACILNLQIEDFDRILCKVLSFQQALIVKRAYNYQVDWANVIYNRCVINGDTKYFKDYVAVKKLAVSLVQDCVRRYRSEKNITHVMTENVKLLISELSDVECKYVLASQLGFKDIVECLLNNPTIGAYLKDTVWKKGMLQS